MNFLIGELTTKNSHSTIIQYAIPRMGLEFRLSALIDQIGAKMEKAMKTLDADQAQKHSHRLLKCIEYADRHDFAEPLKYALNTYVNKAFTRVACYYSDHPTEFQGARIAILEDQLQAIEIGQKHDRWGIATLIKL